MKETIQYVGQSTKSGIIGAVRWVKRFIVTYGILLTLLVFSAFGILELLYIETGIPDHLAPYWISASVGVLVALPVAELARQHISRPPREILHEVDPEDGDFGVKYLRPKQWEELTVVDVARAGDGSLVEVEKEKHDLHQVQADTDDGVETAYECEFYDGNSNTAYVSFFGGVSGTEIRRHKDSAEYLKLEASAERDVHQRLRNLYPDLVEDAVHNRLNYYIHIVEDEVVPGEESIRSIIDSRIQATELQEYVEEDPDFDDLVDMENPFEQESDAKEFYRQQKQDD